MTNTKTGGAMSKIYRPLYPPEGGPCSGYACGECKAVTRTKKGMILHLWTCHGIRIQLRLLPNEAAADSSQDLPKGIRP